MKRREWREKEGRGKGRGRKRRTIDTSPLLLLAVSDGASSEVCLSPASHEISE